MYSSALNPNNVPSGNAKYMKQWIQDYVNIETVRKCFRCGEPIFAGTAVYMATDGKIYTYQTSQDDTYIGVAAENAKTNEFADVVLQGYLRVPNAPWVAGVLYYTNAVGILTPVPVTRRVAVGVGDYEIVVYTQLDPGISAMTADNGLNISSPGNVQLGGTLLKNTTIDTTANYILTIASQNDNWGFYTTNTSATGYGILAEVSNSSRSALYGNAPNGQGVLGTGAVGVWGNGGTGVLAQSGGNALRAEATGTGLAIFAKSQNPSLNGVATVMEIYREPTGVAGSGLGSSIDYTSLTSDYYSVRTNRLISQLINTAYGTSTSRFTITGRNANVEADLLTIEGNGEMNFNKYGVGTFADTPVYYLGVKADGSVVETASSAVVSASNGLTESPANNIKLGGTLTELTTITTGTDYALKITGSTGVFYNKGVFSVESSSPSACAIYAKSTASYDAAIRGESPNSYGVVGDGFFAGVSGTTTGASGIGVIGYSEGVNALAGILLNASTNTVLPVVSLRRATTSGTPAAGMGASIEIKLNSTTSTRIATNIISRWTDATDASRTSQFVVTGVDTGVEAELHTINGNGQHRFNKYGSETFTGTVTNSLGVTSTGWVVEEPVCYLSAADLSDQTAAAATATPMEFDTTNLNYNITITGVNNTDITLAKGGIYNIQFSAQFIRTTGGTGTISVWLAKYNGGTGLWDNVPASNTDYQISGNNEPFVAILNYVESATLNDKYRIYWSSSDGHVQLEHKAAQITPDRPVTPSIILTVWKIA